MNNHKSDRTNLDTVKCINMNKNMDITKELRKIQKYFFKKILDKLIQDNKSNVFVFGYFKEKNGYFVKLMDECIPLLKRLFQTVRFRQLHEREVNWRLNRFLKMAEMIKQKVEKNRTYESEKKNYVTFLVFL